MAASMKLLRCSKCQNSKMTLAAKFIFRSVFTSHHAGSVSRPALSLSSPSLAYWHKSDLPFRSLPHCMPGSSCTFATKTEIEENPLAYSDLLITLEGLDDAVLDHYCQFVTSASKMMNLEVKKKFNLVTENFSQTLAFPPDSYKKENVTYHLKKHGRMIQVAELPAEKSDIFIQYLQDNVPPGVSVHIELKKWQDFVAPPDPRLLEQQRLEREKIEAWKKKNQEKK
ncbi:hypothetical protein ACROYT_G040576 [Oculina patagonica]